MKDTLSTVVFNWVCKTKTKVITLVNQSKPEGITCDKKWQVVVDAKPITFWHSSENRSKSGTTLSKAFLRHLPYHSQSNPK